MAGEEDLGCVLRGPYPEITLIFPIISVPPFLYGELDLHRPLGRPLRVLTPAPSRTGTSQSPTRYGT